MSETFNLVVVSAGTSDPSSTRMLADRTAQRVAALAERRGAAVRTRVIDLRELATDITTALTSQLVTPKLQQAVDALGAADGLIAAAPVYKAGPSGLFTSFFHVLDNDLLIGKPVVLAATAGTARHALVVDDQMRSLFAYLRTLPVPTSLFAAPEDWGASAESPVGSGAQGALNKRIDRAAFELVLLMESGFARQVRGESWQTTSTNSAPTGAGNSTSTPTATSCAWRRAAAPSEVFNVPGSIGSGLQVCLPA